MLLFAFLIGFFTGLRALTAPAVTAWTVYLGWLKLERPLSLIGSLPAAVIFTLLAIAELVADKLPQTPRRSISLSILAPSLHNICSGCPITPLHLLKSKAALCANRLAGGITSTASNPSRGHKKSAAFASFPLICILDTFVGFD
jgi:uncharacterized membrane protein